MDTTTLSLSALEGATDGGGDPATGEAPGVDPGTVDALLAGSALLVVKRGPNAGSRFLLDADVAKAYPTAEAVNKALRHLMQSQEAA